MFRFVVSRIVLSGIGVVAAGGVVTGAGRGQDAIFSEAQAYERFMGRWSRILAPLVVQQQRGGRITFEVGDAQQMRFDRGSFDRTLSLLVVNFIPDAAKAVGEMVRVTRSNGTVAAAVWDYGDGMEMLRVFWDEAIALHPVHAARDERNMPFCRRGELAALWRARGLQDVAEEGLTIETRFASFDDFWAPFLARQGPAGAYVASLSEADRDALRTRLRRRLLGDGPDRPLVMHARAWTVRGTVR